MDRWPKAGGSGECSVLNRDLRISSSFLRYYLWSQVIAGWLLSAIFLAGITGLRAAEETEVGEADPKRKRPRIIGIEPVSLGSTKTLLAAEFSVFDPTRWSVTTGCWPESHLTRWLFAGMLRKITMLPAPAG